MSKRKPDVAADARAWESVKKKFPGTARRELDRVELGDRAATALDDTLNGGHP